VSDPSAANVFLPVLALGEDCLFPESSMTLLVSTPGGLRALEMAARTGGRLLAAANREQAQSARDIHAVGTVATIASDAPAGEDARRVELDGAQRARVVSVVGVDVMVAEAMMLAEGDAGEDWGSAVEALARYLHAHPDLRSFLDQRRRAEPMAWVNLACQHLPITATARQKLLESSAAERCQRISRGVDALLRKEHGA